MISMSKRFIFLISLIALLLCVVASLVFGSRFVPIEQVFNTLLFGYMDSSINHLVVLERIPRTVFGLLAGSSLGVAGILMQSITRNPVADPSILGVNTGASLSVVIGITLFKIGTVEQYIFFAVIGAGITSIFVYSIGSMGRGGATPIKLALAGAATTAALSSIVSALLLPHVEVMNVFRFWQVGSISGATWEGIKALSPFLILGLLLSFLISGSLNALALGDDVAIGLGIRTGRIRLIGAFVGIILCGATTAIAGPIGFVGLMVPHLIRMVFGSDLRWITPMSAIGGAILLLFSDVIGRLIGRPGELEVGIVTAFLGAPILILIAMKAKVRSL